MTDLYSRQQYYKQFVADVAKLMVSSHVALNEMDLCVDARIGREIDDLILTLELKVLQTKTVKRYETVRDFQTTTILMVPISKMNENGVPSSVFAHIRWSLARWLDGKLQNVRWSELPATKRFLKRIQERLIQSVNIKGQWTFSCRDPAEFKVVVSQTTTEIPILTEIRMCPHLRTDNERYVFRIDDHHRFLANEPPGSST